MIDIKKISIEYKIAAVFGAVSFVISFLTGILAGNPAGAVIAKSLILTVVFTGIGYVSIFVLKRYVPEVYDIFSSGVLNQDDDGSVDIPDEGAEVVTEPEAGVAGENLDITDKSDEMPEPEKLNRDDKETELHDISNEHVTTEEAKEKEKIFKYEPEIAAQAIRTMMKRDEK